MKTLAITCAAISAWLHLALAPSHLQEQTYIGVLFVLGGGLLSSSIYGIIRNKEWGWRLGAITCAGMCAALLLSRTIGLYNYKEGWGPEAFTALAVQLGFLAAYFAQREVKSHAYT